MKHPWIFIGVSIVPLLASWSTHWRPKRPLVPNVGSEVLVGSPLGCKSPPGLPLPARRGFEGGSKNPIAMLCRSCTQKRLVGAPRWRQRGHLEASVAKVSLHCSLGASIQPRRVLNGHVERSLAQKEDQGAHLEQPGASSGVSGHLVYMTAPAHLGEGGRVPPKAQWLRFTAPEGGSYDLPRLRTKMKGGGEGGLGRGQATGGWTG